MVENTYKAEILSPYGVVLDADVSYIDAPGEAGRFGVMARHAPMVAALQEGALEVKLENGEMTSLAVSGGILAVHTEKVSVLVRTAERASEIDLERAKEAEQRARERIAQGGPNVDMLKAELALRRAIARLKAAARK